MTLPFPLFPPSASTVSTEMDLLYLFIGSFIVGAVLMEQALKFCQHHGYLKVVLDVRIERGPAIALFQKFGFKHGRTREIGGRKLLDFYIDLYSDPRG